jgi:hypothetical protein
MDRESAPQEIREGVRSGILAAVRHDVELRGGRTARLLAAAGALGVFGAIGITLLLSGHPYGHHPAWHVVVFTAIWSGLLVVSLALAFLRVRTPKLPLARSARVGLVGLGVAGLCGALCPEPHFLRWWLATEAGARLSAASGVALSVLCFGLVTSLFLGAVAAGAALGGARREPIRPLVPSLTLLLLLAPGVALQSVGTSWPVFAGWMLGAAAGAYAGVATGMRVRAWVAAP